jgi:hypothetical protein
VLRKGSRRAAGAGDKVQVMSEALHHPKPITLSGFSAACKAAIDFEHLRRG